MLVAAVALGWLGCGCLGPEPTSKSPPAPAPDASGSASGSSAGASDGGRPKGAPAGAPKHPFEAGRALEKNDLEVARRSFPCGDDVATESEAYLCARIAEASGRSVEAARFYGRVFSLSGVLAEKGRAARLRVLAASADHEGALAALDAIEADSGVRLSAVEKRELLSARARHLAALGRAGEAVAAFDAARSAGASGDELALDAADALIAAGEAKKAAALLLPLSESAKRASAMRRATARLAELGMTPPLTDAERLERAGILIDKKAYDDAAALLAPLLDSKVSKTAAEAAWLNARQLYERRRHYSEAAEALHRIAEGRGPHAAQAKWLEASALARSDREPEAIAAYRKIAKGKGDGARAAEALFLSSRLAFYVGRNGDALAGMEKLVGAGKRKAKNAAKPHAKPSAAPRANASIGPDRALEAHFIAGMAALLSHKAAKAGAHLEAASDGERNAEALARNHYWRAVALAATGAEEGRKALAAICEEDATSWYALHAKRRLLALGAGAEECTEPPVPPNPKTPDGEAEVPLERLSAEAALLAGIGLFAEAAEELRGAEKANPKLASDEAFVRHYVALDAPQHAVRRASRALSWPPADAASAAAARVAYPEPYAEEVRALEASHSLPRRLLYAIARKESLFDPSAVSSAGALGMMQMMPRTYEANRARAGLPPLAEGAIPSPRESLTAAAFELESLLARFGGSVPLAIMAYNGGASAVSHWLERAGGEPLDVFVEKAGFVETRNYVRRVTQNLVRYALLAGDEPPALPEKALAAKAADLGGEVDSEAPAEDD